MPKPQGSQLQAIVADLAWLPHTPATNQVLAIKRVLPQSEAEVMAAIEQVCTFEEAHEQSW